MRIGILEPCGFSPIARELLSTLGPVDDYCDTDRKAFLANKEALFVRLGHRIDDEFLLMTPRLAYLCSPTTGHTHIDIAALSRRGVALLSLHGATEFMKEIRATPEHALGLILALLRHYRDAFLGAHNDHWDRDRCRGEELAGMTVGLIGFGRVGRRISTYLRAFDTNIACFDPLVRDVPSYVRRYDRMADLIAASRIVVLAASYAEGMPPVVDAAAVAALSGKYFVNVARGELVDEEELLTAVEAGRLAGCAVDVIRNETGINNRLRWLAAAQQSNVIVTPHIGGATFKSMHLTEEFIARKLIEAAAAAGGRRGVS